jgi:excisionase family DNA binding protein
VARAIRALLAQSSVMPSKSKQTNAAGSLPALVSVREIAEATGLSTKTVRRLIAAGKLPAVRLGPRSLRVERETVLELLREGVE